jgi:hypothetical protein
MYNRTSCFDQINFLFKRILQSKQKLQLLLKQKVFTEVIKNAKMRGLGRDIEVYQKRVGSLALKVRVAEIA